MLLSLDLTDGHTTLAVERGLIQLFFGFISELGSRTWRYQQNCEPFITQFISIIISTSIRYICICMAVTLKIAMAYSVAASFSEPRKLLLNCMRFNIANKARWQNRKFLREKVSGPFFYIFKAWLANGLHIVNIVRATVCIFYITSSYFRSSSDFIVRRLRGWLRWSYSKQNKTTRGL